MSDLSEWWPRTTLSFSGAPLLASQAKRVAFKLWEVTLSPMTAPFAAK